MGKQISGLTERRILSFTPSDGVTGLNVIAIDSFIMVTNGLKIAKFNELPSITINGISYKIVGKAANTNSFRRSGPEVNHMYNCIISNGDGYSAVDTKQLTLGYDGTNSYILMGTTGSPTYLYLSAPYRILNTQEK